MTSVVALRNKCFATKQGEYDQFAINNVALSAFLERRLTFEIQNVFHGWEITLLAQLLIFIFSLQLRAMTVFFLNHGMLKLNALSSSSLFFSLENLSCDVFAWGSNSSHQLAEPGSEKVLTPKKADSFANTQLVCITFILFAVELYSLASL